MFLSHDNPFEGTDPKFTISIMWHDADRMPFAAAKSVLAGSENGKLEDESGWKQDPGCFWTDRVERAAKLAASLIRYAVQCVNSFQAADIDHSCITNHSEWNTTEV